MIGYRFEFVRSVPDAPADLADDEFVIVREGDLPVLVVTQMNLAGGVCDDCRGSRDIPQPHTDVHFDVFKASPDAGGGVDRCVHGIKSLCPECSPLR